MAKLAKKIFTSLTLSFSFLGVVFLQKQTLSTSYQSPLENYSHEIRNDQVFLDTQRRMPTLGFGNLLADWTFLRFIQYFGDTEARDVTGYQLVPLFFRNIVTEDPRFTQALLILSGANTMYALSPKQTVTFLNQALKTLTPQVSSLSPYVWSYKGVDEMLFLGSNKAAQYSYEMAAKWAKARGDTAAADRNEETATFLANNPDSKKARVAAWTSILENALDDSVRKRAVQEIKTLGGNVEQTQGGQLKITFPDKD